MLSRGPIQVKADKLVLRRAAAYFLARLSQNVELHDAILAAGGLAATLKLANDPDLECQEYAAFTLAFLSTK